MRIFYAAENSANVAIPSSTIWYKNLYLPLVDLGHEVVRFEYDLLPHFRYLDPVDPAAKTFIDDNRPALEAALLAQIESAHREKPIDLFFSYFYSALCRPKVIEDIRAMGIVTANWYCNASYQFHLVREIAPAYDYCLVPERYRMDDYRRVGARPIYMQEAANPNTYGRQSLAKTKDVTFVGQCYGDRPTHIQALTNARVDVQVFGQGWDQLRRPERIRDRIREEWQTRVRREPRPIPNHVLGSAVSDDEMIRLLSESRIVLGFSSCGETHATSERIVQVRLRDFEVPMSGAFYLVEHSDELAEFFEPEKEIATYVDVEDLVQKVKYYLNHPEKREAIRAAGERRARTEHTWHRRFQKAFAEMGLPASGGSGNSTTHVVGT